MVAGNTYRFSARAKLTSSGERFECNVDGDAASCPRATLKPSHGFSEAQWPNVGLMATGNQEWNVMEGTYTLTDFDAQAGMVALYINGAPEGVDIQVAEVSMALVVPTEAPSASPTALQTEDSASPFANTEETVSREGDALVFSSASGQDATALTTAAYEGDIEIQVEIQERETFGSGYLSRVGPVLGHCRNQYRGRYRQRQLVRDLRESRRGHRQGQAVSHHRALLVFQEEPRHGRIHCLGQRWGSLQDDGRPKVQAGSHQRDGVRLPLRQRRLGADRR